MKYSDRQVPYEVFVSYSISITIALFSSYALRLLSAGTICSNGYVRGVHLY